MRGIVLMLTVAITLTACGIKGDPLPIDAEAPCPFCE